MAFKFLYFCFSFLCNKFTVVLESYAVKFYIGRKIFLLNKFENKNKVVLTLSVLLPKRLQHQGVLENQLDFKTSVFFHCNIHVLDSLYVDVILLFMLVLGSVLLLVRMDLSILLLSYWPTAFLYNFLVDMKFNLLSWTVLISVNWVLIVFCWENGRALFSGERHYFLGFILIRKDSKTFVAVSFRDTQLLFLFYGNLLICFRIFNIIKSGTIDQF